VCLEEALRVQNTHWIRQSANDCVPGHKYSIPGLPRTTFVAHQVWAIWFIVRRWGWDVDMPGALVADEMGFGKTFTSMAAAMICKLLTVKVVMEPPQLILWRNTLEKWVNMGLSEFPWIIGEEREWYPLRRQNSVPRCHIEFQTSPPQEHPVLTSALELILVVIIPGVAEMFNGVLDEMTHRTDSELINLLHVNRANITNEDLNASIDKPENWWNMHLLLYDTLKSKAKQSSNGQISYCVWSYGIFNESHWYKSENSMGWQIPMKATIGLKLQVTATPRFHSLQDWYYHMMWLISGEPEDPEDDTVMEKHGADALYSAVKSLMHAIWTECKAAQEDAAHWMI